MHTQQARNNIFARTGSVRPGKSVFDLSYSKLFDCDMGQLIPVMCEEALPGDVWRISNEMVIRFQPLMAPVLHEINAYVHYFFVHIGFYGLLQVLTTLAVGTSLSLVVCSVLRLFPCLSGFRRMRPRRGVIHFGITLDSRLTLMCCMLVLYILLIFRAVLIIRCGMIFTVMRRYRLSWI